MISVLYVDDETALLEIGKRFLERGGLFSVDTVESASEALLYITEKGYDAIISDYQMPGMDGIEFLKKVRASGNNVPFIIFTGRGREEVVIEALNEGVDFYLQKGGEPVSQFAELAHKIQKAVLQRRAEASIRDHERRESDIINFLPDATFAIDNRGVVIAWNRAMEKMTGIPSLDILGKGNHEYGIPFYRERRPILIDLVLKDDPVTEAKYPYITRSGEKLFSEITIPHMNDGKGAALWFTASPLYDTKGCIIGAIESIRDITERKQRDHILRTQSDLGTALQSVRGLNSTMMTCLNAAIEISGMDAGGIYLVDGVSGSIDLIVSQNLGYEFVQSVSRYPSGSENARMIMAGKPIYVQYSETGIIHSPVQEQEGLKVAAIIPILHNSRVIASLNITSHTMNEIPAIARVALEMIATQIGSAIERIRADEALIESEQRYRDVVEDQTEFISRFLPDGTHIFVNEAYCRYFGLKREAILGHRFRPEIPVEDQERVRQFFESLTPGNPVDTIVHRIIMPDGGIRWQRWSDRANFDPFGTITEYQSVGRDITHTKEAEIALQASEARYRTLLTSVNEGIWVIDTDAVTTYVNPIMAGMLGYTVDEMVGKGLFMFMDEAWRAVAAGKFSERKEGASEQHEFRFQKKDGSYITTLMSTAPLHNTDGSFAGGIATVIDIGRRKGTEDALRESEERLHTIMQSVQTGIIIIDAATHIILDANPKALAMIGAGTEDEVIGSVCHQFICPCELGQCPIADLGQEIDASERVLVTNQGEHIPVLKTVIPAIINGKKVLVESLSDISEQQQIAGALRVSEEKYRLLFEKSNDAIFIADPKTRMLIDCNERAEVITGYSRQEINSMRADQLHPEDVLEKTMEYFQKYALGMDTSVESAIITKDNRRVPVSINASRVDITGRTSIIGIFRDITDQKRAEDVLRQRTEELDYRNRLISTLLDTVPMGIFMVEAPSGRPIIANREATRLLGRGIMSDAKEENLADIYNASRAGTSVPYPAKDMPIIRGMHGELSYVDDMVVERPDGTRVRLEIYGAPIFDNQDRIVASLVSFLDITDRKRTEQVIRETNRKINLLASITRHDVANQVTILKGYAQIALMEQPDPVVADLLSKIEAAGSIISRVIEFTRSYQELGMHAPGWYRVSEMVSRHKPENIQISCTCDAEVFADPMLEKVFFNLIDNSIRHGERVTVIRIRCEQEMDGLTITVEDDGTGVPPDCKEKIFLKGYGKNTGFGLFLAREILAITSITIRETGEPGKGAVFTITVPKGSYRITAPV